MWGPTSLRVGPVMNAWWSCIAFIFNGVWIIDPWMKTSIWLFNLFFSYFLWCWLDLPKCYLLTLSKKQQWGIPNGCRARPILFQTATLQKNTTAYPVIGQKKLNGAASRMMIHWASAISRSIRESHPSETNRCDEYFVECSYFCIFKSYRGEILDCSKFLLVPWVAKNWPCQVHQWSVWGSFCNVCDICWAWAWMAAGECGCRAGSGIYEI